MAKNHQWGCRSSATVSWSLSSFFGYGMEGNSTALTLGSMDPSTLLDDLDAEQRHAVATDSRLVAVIAGAGSGKTRVLTRRIAHRVVTGTADARHTLVLTFTREAASELRRRLPRLGLGERVEAGTFHSVMLGLLRQRWADRNRPAPTLVDDRRRLVGEIAGRAALDETRRRDQLGGGAGHHARGVPERGPTRRAQAAARRRPDRDACSPTTATTSGGAVSSTSTTCSASPSRRCSTTTTSRPRHDGASGTCSSTRRRTSTRSSTGSSTCCATTHDDLFLVGDPAQAIFAFNGTDPSLLIDVSDRFPGIEIVRLPTNHRCTPQIVEAGAHVLAAGGQPATSDPAGPTVTPSVSSTAPTRSTRPRLVARLIRHLDPGLVGTGGVAVLARTNAQLVAIRASIEHAGIPVRRRIDGAGSPYRDAVGAASRQGSAARLRSWAHDLLDGLDPDGHRVVLTPEQVRVADSVLDFLREQPLGDGVAYRSWVSTTDPFDLRDDRGVELLTFHGAKGREWHTVFVTGVETGLVPIRSASTGRRARRGGAVAVRRPRPAPPMSSSSPGVPAAAGTSASRAR